MGQVHQLAGARDPHARRGCHGNRRLVEHKGQHGQFWLPQPLQGRVSHWLWRQKSGRSYLRAEYSNCCILGTQLITFHQIKLNHSYHTLLKTSNAPFIILSISSIIII